MLADLSNDPFQDISHLFSARIQNWYHRPLLLIYYYQNTIFLNSENRGGFRENGKKNRGGFRIFAKKFA